MTKEKAGMISAPTQKLGVSFYKNSFEVNNTGFSNQVLWQKSRSLGSVKTFAAVAINLFKLASKTKSL